MVKYANMTLLYQMNRLQLFGWCDTSPLASHILRYHLIPQTASDFLYCLARYDIHKRANHPPNGIADHFTRTRRFESSTTSVLETANPLPIQPGTDTPDSISRSSFWRIKLQPYFLPLQLTAYPQTDKILQY
jgi:hypothetical protein